MTWQDIPGWFDWQNIYDEWAERCTSNSVIVEVGVWRGRSLAYLTTQLAKYEKYPLVYGIDTWAESQVPELREYQDTLEHPSDVMFEAMENIRRCDPKRLATLVGISSVSAARHFSRVDFCLIDADHTYDSVFSDLDAWSSKMRPGGQMAGHDYTDNWPGVRRAVDDFFRHSELRPRLSGNCWVVDF